MKISIRTLKQEKYEFTLDENDTIDALKTLIQEKLGHEKSWQNLIFSGTMLDSSRTIASYKITEKDFLVLLVKKPRDAPAAQEPKQEAPKPAQPTEPKAVQPTPQPSQPAAQPSQPTQPSQPAAQPTQPSQPASADTAPFGIGREEHEGMIRRIMEMGFERTQVERALQASFFNGDRAVELLMTGVPIPDLADVQGLQAMQGVLDDADMGDEDEDEDEEGMELGDAGQLFEMLRNSSQFAQLRNLARTNPEALEQVLTQLPPQILAIISANQEEFLRLLTEDAPTGGAGAGAAPAGAVPQAQPCVVTLSLYLFLKRQRTTITLTPEDQAIINNLVDMGFDKNRVTEAYVLFGKDADMTANYLLNHGWDDLPPQRFNGQ